MSSLFKEFKTDPKLESDGIEYVYTSGDGLPVFKCHVARTGGSNKKYDLARERITAPYRRLAKLTPEMSDQIALEVFAEAIVVKDSWYTYVPKDKAYVPGIETPTGDIVPATPEAIVAAMKELPDLYNLLLSESININNYKRVALEQDAKN